MDHYQVFAALVAALIGGCWGTVAGRNYVDTNGPEVGPFVFFNIWIAVLSGFSGAVCAVIMGIIAVMANLPGADDGAHMAVTIKWCIAAAVVFGIWQCVLRAEIDRNWKSRLYRASRRW